MSATTPPTRTSVPQVRRPASGLEVARRVAGSDLASTPAPPASSAPPEVRTAEARPPELRSPELRSPEVALLPNVLIAGVPHAGAGMLAADLARHPQICSPSDRRPGLFAPLRFGRPVEIHPHDYDRHYAGWSGQRYRLETSPAYFDGGRPMAQALAERLPDLRVIVLLRDPAHRLWTGYTDQLARRRLPGAMTFDTFLDRCLTLRANRADRFEGNRHFRTLSGGFYIDYLPHWLDLFGDRLRVVFTENLQEEPAGGARDVHGWLGLDPAEASPPAAVPDAGTGGRTDSGGRADVAVGGGYPVPEASTAFNRRFWPVLQRTSGSWRALGAGDGPVRTPRQTERARVRSRSLYATANAELAGLLRDRGLTVLPVWLADAEV